MIDVDIIYGPPPDPEPPDRFSFRIGPASLHITGALETLFGRRPDDGPDPQPDIVIEPTSPNGS